MSTLSFDFMRYRRFAAICSLILFLLSIISIATKGLNLGLDFVGGTKIELQLDRISNLEKIRNYLKSNGVEDASVINFGSAYDISIRTKMNINDERANAIAQALIVENIAQKIAVLKVDYVGPQIGEELREDGGIGMFVALLLVMLYVAFKFQYKFSIGAVVALFHDVVITIGLFSIFQWNFDLTVVAAILAIIGYSLNDTIVVSDRIRENIRRSKKRSVMLQLLNSSLVQVFSRTIITSSTTLLVVLVLFIFGGETLTSLSITLIIGIIIGTYSSIYVATNILVLLNLTREDMLEKKEEAAE